MSYNSEYSGLDHDTAVGNVKNKRFSAVTPTVAAMRAFFPGEFLAVRTLGESAVNDGGGRLFYWSGDIDLMAEVAAHPDKYIAPNEYPDGDHGAMIAIEEPQTPYTIGVFLPGTLPEGSVIFSHIFAEEITFPEMLSGSRILALLAATDAANIGICLRPAGDCCHSQIGALTWAADGTVPEVSFPGYTFAAGDILMFISQSTADVSLGDIGLTLVGERA